MCKKVVGARRLFSAKSVVNASRLPKSAPFAKEFLQSMAIVVDFWAEPSYAQLLHASRSAFMTTLWPTKARRQEALDCLVDDWKAVFKEEGK